MIFMILFYFHAPLAPLVTLLTGNDAMLVSG